MGHSGGKRERERERRLRRRRCRGAIKVETLSNTSERVRDVMALSELPEIHTWISRCTALKSYDGREIDRPAARWFLMRS